ncbi:MAG: inositol monophosphatase family protein [Pseudanabaenaceae cyanobacterium bins.39]|nr:inositol monophosphatase family protein [Pseudanabaenaceae cyanobacterium bins.39]
MTSFATSFVTSKWQSLVPFLQNLTQQVGDRLLMDFDTARVAIEKDDGSLVTKSDQWADEYIRTALGQEFPNYDVLTEESSQILTHREWSWVVDPLDGTTNFARGIPIWGISIGLLHFGTPVFGYIAMPPLRQHIYGWFDGDDVAAFMNGRSLHLPKHLESSDVQLDHLANYFFSACSRSLEKIGKSKFPFKLRMLGAASYNLLTVGLGSTIGAIEATPKIWDIAAVWVILQATGVTWIYLDADWHIIDHIFPLALDKNYQQQSFPSLVVRHPQLVAIAKQIILDH